MKLSQNTFDKASDTLFTFQITNLPGLISPEDSSNLLLNCNQLSIPGISIGVRQENWQGGRIAYPMGNIEFNTIDVVFLVDENLSNWKALFKWVLFTNNNKDKYAVAWDDPVTTGLLEYKNNWLNKTVLKMDFWKLWCSGVGAIQLTTKTDGSQYLEATGSFVFDRVELQ